MEILRKLTEIVFKKEKPILTPEQIIRGCALDAYWGSVFDHSKEPESISFPIPKGLRPLGSREINMALRAIFEEAVPMFGKAIVTRQSWRGHIEHDPSEKIMHLTFSESCSDLDLDMMNY